jgi:hypothetical protein
MVLYWLIFIFLLSFLFWCTGRIQNNMNRRLIQILIVVIFGGTFNLCYYGSVCKVAEACAFGGAFK